jgi:hypothetical protein
VPLTGKISARTVRTSNYPFQLLFPRSASAALGDLDCGASMYKEPELIIGHDVNHFPTTAMCSGCRAGMRDPEPVLTHSEDVIRWYVQQFAAHVRLRHGS